MIIEEGLKIKEENRTDKGKKGKNKRSETKGTSK